MPTTGKKISPKATGKPLRGSSRKATREKKHEAILVVGMHRAGTSALTRCLSLLGYSLPRTLMGANSSNQKGHWESSRLARLNDRILTYFNKDWLSWLPIDLSHLTTDTRRQFQDEILTVIRGEYDSGCPIIIKDPRVSRLVPLYQAALEAGGYIPKFVLAGRHPFEVAASLKARNNMFEAEAHLLWLRYCLDAEISTRKSKRAFTDYSRLLSDPETYLAKIIKAAALKPDHALEDALPEIKLFLDNGQRHAVKSLEDIMLNDEFRDWLGGVYQSWLLMSENSRSKTSLGKFDKIRTEFDVAAPQLLRHLQARQAEKIEAERLWRKKETQLQADIETLRHEITQYKSKLKQKGAENSDIESANRYLQKDLDAAVADIAITKEQLSHTEEQLSHTKSKLRSSEKDKVAATAAAKTLRSEKRQLNREKWALQDKASVANDMVRALQQSTSWKVTQPLRFVKRLLRPQAAGLQPIQTEGVAPAPAEPSEIILPSPTVKSKVSAKDIAKVEASGLFDAVYYVTCYPEVQGQTIDPLAHYLIEGWQKGYQPSEKFNGQAYLAAHPGLKEKNENPLLHYIAASDSKKPSKSDIKAVGRVAVFMAVAGPYDAIKEPETISDMADYFVFTDQDLPPNSVWQKCELEYFDADPTRMARFIKTHPHLYFSDYDWALWVDANLQLNVTPEQVIAPIVREAVLATWVHPLRNCIFDEAIECAKRSKDDDGVMDQQMKRYQAASYPALNGLFETSVMASKMGDPSIKALMNSWWAEIEQGSRRDQLSLPFIVHQHKVKVGQLAPKGVCMRSDPRFNYYRHQK